MGKRTKKVMFSKGEHCKKEEIVQRVQFGGELKRVR